MRSKSTSSIIKTRPSSAFDPDDAIKTALPMASGKIEGDIE